MDFVFLILLKEQIYAFFAKIESKRGFICITNKTSLAVYKLFGIASIILLYKILIYKSQYQEI